MTKILKEEKTNKTVMMCDVCEKYTEKGVVLYEPQQKELLPKLFDFFYKNKKHCFVCLDCYSKGMDTYDKVAYGK